MCREFLNTFKVHLLRSSACREDIEIQVNISKYVLEKKYLVSLHIISTNV